MKTKTVNELPFKRVRLCIINESGFVPRFGRRVKATGGSYDNYEFHRSIRLPSTERELVDEILCYHFAAASAAKWRGYDATVEAEDFPDSPDLVRRHFVRSRKRGIIAWLNRRVAQENELEHELHLR